MNVYLNSITGIDDAIVSMYMSKRNWSRELEKEIRRACGNVLDEHGLIYGHTNVVDFTNVCDWIDKLVKFGWRHITLLKFIDISVTVEGLHRGGQDDWDSHAKRFDNRIIRASTRLADFGNEVSDWYKDKIIPTDEAMSILGIQSPDEIEIDGVKYVKAINGYVRADMANDRDVKRGLYMLSIPSSFIFKSNLADFAHVYKERNIDGTANPEVKELCETICDQIEVCIPAFNRELFAKIKN